MKIIVFFVCFTFLLTFNFLGAVKEVKGIFKGENLLVRSAIDQESKEYCITDVYLNGEKLELNLSTITIEIPLNSILLKGDQVSLRIYYRAGCEPTIVNPGVIKRKTLFAFLSFTISEEGFRWTTRGETNESYYSVQRLEEGKWITSVKGKFKCSYVR